MTDDLVKRLRVGIHTSADEQALRDEAADRIEALDAEMKLVMEINERLLAALREIADNFGACYYDIDPHVCLRAKRARAALAGEKKDG